MRPIDADVILKKFSAECEYSDDCKKPEPCITCIINGCPTLDVELIKHGQWIRAEAKGYPVKCPSIWYCSECGEKIKYNDTLGRYQKTKKTVSQINPRCRKCGARMDGENT